MTKTKDELDALLGNIIESAVFGSPNEISAHLYEKRWGRAVRQRLADLGIQMVKGGELRIGGIHAGWTHQLETVASPFYTEPSK